MISGDEKTKPNKANFLVRRSVFCGLCVDDLWNIESALTVMILKCMVSLNMDCGP